MTSAPVLLDWGRLVNGIPFVAHHRPGAEVTTVSVWILSGSRHEAAPGVAHLLEHAVMRAVPVGRRMRAIDELELTDGEANAITSRDHVVLYTRVPSADAEAALAVLADAVTSSTFDDELVEAERRVVQEELRRACADPTDIVHDVFFALAFGADPIGRPNGGTAAEVARLGVADLAAWARRNVRAGQLGVAASGTMTADALATTLAGTRLGALSVDPVARPADRAPDPTPGRRDHSLASDTSAVLLGGPAFALDDPRLGAAEIVMELLARGNGSILQEELHSCRGLCYDLAGHVSAYRDTGVWQVAMSTAPEHRDPVVDLATELVQDAAGRGWTETEVAFVRRRVHGQLRLEVESSLEDVLLLGLHALVGGQPGWSLARHLARLATVDAEQVNQCARLMSQRLVVATAGASGRQTAAAAGGQVPHDVREEDL